MIVKRGATIVPEAVLTKNLGIRTQLAFIQSGGGSYDLESGTWFHHVDDGPVFHLFGLSFGPEVLIKVRTVGDSQDFTRLRTHQDDGRLLWRIFLHRRVDFVLDDALQPEIDSQVHLVTVTRRALLPAVRHVLLAGAVVLDETVAVLFVQIFFH